MRRLLRVGGPAVLAILLIAVGLAWWLAGSGRPRRSGRESLPGLEAQVRVRWDAFGVPHVTASSGLDAARAVGWLHAGDRMLQLELSRRAAAGRLSEILGAGALAVDRRCRELRLAATATAHEAALGAESRAWLEAYAEGVNAWLAAGGGDLPPELRVLGVEPEPWTPTDSLGVGLLLMADLSFLEWRMDEQRYLWWRELGAERARELAGAPGMELAPELAARLDAQLDAEERAREAGAGDASESDAERFAPAEAPDEPEERGGVSNNWAVSAARSATGAPLVANDPHLRLGLPSVWYQVRVVAPDYDVAGVTLVGMPVVLIGMGADVAWSLTNHAVDDHDYLFEELDAEHGVRRGTRFEPLLESVERIVVRGGDDVELRVRYTELGPLLPADEERGLPARTLNWAGYHAVDVVSAFLGLARASDLDGVRAAIDSYRCPSQNLVLATRDGDLMATLLGRSPERASGDGRLPVPGWSPERVWRAFRSADERLERVNPPAGFLATANNDVLPRDYPRSHAAEFDVPHRSARIAELLASRTDWTAEALAAMQSDVVSHYALEIAAAVQVPEFTGDARAAAEALSAWDGSMRVAGPAALFALVERDLAEAIFDDELSTADLRPLGGPTRRFALLRLLAGELSPGWWDDVRTAEVETRAAILQRVLAGAWREGRERFGDAVEAWSYGELHPWTLRHPLGDVPLLGARLNRGPFEVAGSRTSICAWYGSWSGSTDGASMPVGAGPSLRWVADLADPDRSRVVLPGGQSGHPFDAHYDDQLELFLRGESRTVAWSERAIAAATVSELVLSPR